MSEFNDFEGSAEDPAAEFLAREQNEMAGLEDEGFGGSQAAPAAQGDLFGGDGDSAGALQGGAPSADFIGAPSDDFTGADPAFDAFEAPAGQDPISLDGDMGAAQPTGYEAIAQVDRIREEPEKIKIWREEQKVRLEKKDKDSEEKKGEWREIAKKELEDWYKHREEQLEKTFKLNRIQNKEAEAAFCQERDEKDPGHEWERICRLCEFNPKAARNQKDVSRLRSILLQLKQTPLVR